MAHRLSHDPQHAAAYATMCHDLDDQVVSNDAFGRQAHVDYAPSDLVRAGIEERVPAHVGATFIYERQGHLSSVALDGIGGEAAVSYTRDGRGRVTGVTSGGPAGDIVVATDVAYDVEDRMRQVVLGNGTTSTWTYDPLQPFLTEIAYVDAQGHELDRMAYVPDANLNIVSECRSRGHLLPTTKEHRYDAFDRLRSTSMMVLGEMFDENDAYSPGGNLLSAAGLRFRFDNGANTQAVTTVEGAHRVRALQYDADGQLVADDDENGDVSVHRTLKSDASGCLRTVVETLEGPDGHHRSTTTHVGGVAGVFACCGRRRTTSRARLRV